MYIWNDAGELLLLHRRKPPNQDLFSPIGGKLEQQLGESPYTCALREVKEEIAVTLTLDDIRLVGIVSERAYASGTGQSHWLMFCFEVLRPLNFPARQIDEGRLEWHDPSKITELPIPKTDRDIIWPLVQKHSARSGRASFFSVHIDCTDAEAYQVTREHPRLD